MTLVVARIERGRIAIASDTLITNQNSPLPHQHGTLKSCMLPGDICVSFANSPETAEAEFSKFAHTFVNGVGYSETVSFFEESSGRTGNDYIVAFSRNPKILKIADGRRVQSVSKTVWIGEKAAYERFREFESKSRQSVEHGRALNVVLFADELEKLPASNLYSAMRNVISDKTISSVGGFVSVVSDRGNGFRFSVYSDMLFDWPDGKSEDYIFKLDDPINLNASDENIGYSIAQISPGYMGINAAAYYYVKGKKLFFFYAENNGLASKCVVLGDVEAGDIALKLNQLVQYDLKWLLLITSGTPSAIGAMPREKGAQLGFLTHANTLPKPPSPLSN